MSLRRSHRQTRLEARDDRPSQTQVAARKFERQTGIAGSQPQFRISLPTARALIAKATRHHADNLIRVVVEPQSFSNDVRIGAELSSPEAVTEDDFQIEAGRGVARIED